MGVDSPSRVQRTVRVYPSRVNPSRVNPSRVHTSCTVVDVVHVDVVDYCSLASSVVHLARVEGPT